MNAPHLTLLPFDVEAEKALIGAVMIDPAGIVKIPFVQPSHFYRENHQQLYKVLLDLSEREVGLDPITVSGACEDAGILAEVGGPAAISDFCTRCPSAWHITHYAEIVYNKAMARTAIAGSERVVKKAMSGKLSLVDLRRETEATAASIYPLAARDALDNSDLARRLVAQVRDIRDTGEAPLLPVSLAPLREHIHGWELKRVTVLGGLSSVGKTKSAIQESVALAREGKNVVYVSVEIDAMALASAFVAHIGEIDETQLIRGFMDHDKPNSKDTRFPYRRHSWDELEYDNRTAADKFAQLPIRIVARDYDCEPPVDPDFSPAGIIARLKKLDSQEKIDFVVVDHLYILDYKNTDNAYAGGNEYGQTVMAFRKFAEYADAHVLLLHQLEPQKALAMMVPNAACFPGSQRVWQNTDNMIALYAPHMHDKNATDKTVRAMNIIKARRGITGIVDNISFKGAISKFTAGIPKSELASRFSKPVADDDIDF